MDRIDNVGVKLLGAPIGTKAFTMGFVKKKLDSLEALCGTKESRYQTHRSKSGNSASILRAKG